MGKVDTTVVRGTVYYIGSHFIHHLARCINGRDGIVKGSEWIAGRS